MAARVRLVSIQANVLEFRTVAQSAKPSSSDITVTLKRLVALLEEDETDEYGILQPSQSAFKLAMRLVVDAYWKNGMTVASGDHSVTLSR